MILKCGAPCRPSDYLKTFINPVPRFRFSELESKLPDVPLIEK